MDPEKMKVLGQLMTELGAEVEVSTEEAEAYFPQVDSNFYVPKPYTSNLEALRRASIPDPNVFRRLLGMK